VLPDLESIRCFCAAALSGNFRAAARTVALSPAAFGDRIKRLEAVLGATLFQRTTRRVALTAEGERLLPHARRLLDDAERSAEVVRAPHHAPPMSLVLGTRFELGMSWLLPAIGALERARPERRLHLFFGDTPALLAALEADRIDAFVSSARITSGGLVYARLHEERYVFVASRKLAAREPLSRPEHAPRHTLLEINAELPLFRYFLDARPGDEVWAFAHVQWLGTIAPVRARVLEGAGVAVLPLYFVERDLASGRLVRLMPAVRMPVDWFRLVWRETHRRQEELHTLAGELSRFALR
jgi:DNA-binding transcriptional LysR family regulator